MKINEKTYANKWHKMLNAIDTDTDTAIDTDTDTAIDTDSDTAIYSGYYWSYPDKFGYATRLYF